MSLSMACSSRCDRRIRPEAGAAHSRRGFCGGWTKSKWHFVQREEEKREGWRVASEAKLYACTMASLEAKWQDAKERRPASGEAARGGRERMRKANRSRLQGN